MPIMHPARPNHSFILGCLEYIGCVAQFDLSRLLNAAMPHRKCNLSYGNNRITMRSQLLYRHDRPDNV